MKERGRSVKGGISGEEGREERKGAKCDEGDKKEGRRGEGRYREKEGKLLVWKKRESVQKGTRNDEEGR